MRRCSRNTRRRWLRFKRRRHHRDDARGRAHGTAGEVDEGVDAFAGGEEFFAAKNFVIEPDAKQRFLSQISDDREDVVVQCGPVCYCGAGAQQALNAGITACPECRTPGPMVPIFMSFGRRR